VTVDKRTLALCRVAGTCTALDNRCPHQGGPLGEGSIENQAITQHDSSCELTASAHSRSPTAMMGE